jgi:glucan phosphoethanolaminetransferase (alkaline phosphatase superfamily)
MKALCLFGVFFVAKVLFLTGHDIPVSIWTPFAYFWQDLLFVLIFAALDWPLRHRPWIGWSVYGLITSYTAINVPITYVLSTPLTWPLLRATGGTLADSIIHYVTPNNVLRMGAVITVAIILPLIAIRRRIHLSRRTWVVLVLVAMLALPLGWVGTSRIATQGLHRNVVTILVTTAIPHIAACDLSGDWRRSPFGSPPGDDLTFLRGKAAGRNVIVIHLESTGACYLMPYGAAENPMPRLTEISRHALLFEKAYTTYPETIRSLFAPQCGLFPALDTKPDQYEQANSPALAEVLARNGYRTGLFHSGRFMYLGMDKVIRNKGYQTLEDAGDIGGEHDSSFGIDELSTVRRILKWIDQGPRNKPFLVSYLPIAGHHPYESPGPFPFPQDTEIGCYRNSLLYADNALGLLLDGLRQRGLYENTLFVIFGDHSEAFGQHEGNVGHTLHLYEENIHVPLVVAVPGVTDSSLRVSRPVSLVDITPTVLDLLGMAVSREYQGCSLLDAQSNLALFCTDYSLGLLGLRDGRWKFHHELDSSRSMLFDLESDPDEKNDLADQHPERVDAYREHLLNWASAQKHLVTQNK